MTSRAQGVLAVEGQGDQGVGPVLGVLLGLGQLLEDHPALQVDLVGPHGGAQHQVAQQVEGEAGVGGGDPDLHGGALAVGDRVEVAAPLVDGLGHLGGRPAVAALAEQVLEEVRHPGQRGRLVAAAHARPGPPRWPRPRPACGR